MIARSWDGVTEARRANEYLEYLRRTGVADTSSTEGNQGVYVLRREEPGGTRFRFVSLWDSMEAIRRFAGPEPERARYYPEDEQFLRELEPCVEHFQVEIATRPERGSEEARELAEELRALWSGEPWHGPSLASLLEGVSAEQARTRPVTGGHSLWELVLHIAAWTDVCRRRLEGEAVVDPAEGDFPPVAAGGAAGWDAARARLEDVHRRLAERVARLTERELDATLPGLAYSARYLIHGTICHVVYHSGQIALLRKAAPAAD
jgi:heme-degrading monooxygenase HmoA/uncharacterized damage-inducible protein DinB